MATESKPGEAVPADAAAANAAEIKPAETEPAETKPDETKPDESEAAKPEAAASVVEPSLESQLAELTGAKLAEAKSAEDEPVEARLPERISRENPAVLIPERREALRPPDVKREPRPPRVGRWRAVAALMTLVAIGLGGLIAAWRYVPERLPPQLRPTAVLKIPEGVAAPVRKPAPPESQFDE
jgi:hypothetical protein